MKWWLTVAGGAPSSPVAPCSQSALSSPVQHITLWHSDTLTLLTAGWWTCDDVTEVSPARCVLCCQAGRCGERRRGSSSHSASKGRRCDCDCDNQTLSTPGPFWPTSEESRSERPGLRRNPLFHRMWCGVVWCSVVWCGVVRCGASLTNVNKPEETGLARCMSAELTVYPSSPARKVGSGFAFSRKINIRNYI